MVVEGCRVEIRYDVIDQSFLADEVMEILNLSERQYAASLEMQLLDCTRHLRATTYSRLIHSGWDILRFDPCFILAIDRSQATDSKAYWHGHPDTFASMLDLELEGDRIDLSSILAEELGNLTLTGLSEAGGQGSSHLTEALAASLISTLDRLAGFLSSADVAPLNLCRYLPSQSLQPSSSGYDA